MNDKIAEADDHSSQRRRDEFATTLWSVVVLAGAEGANAALALQRLCDMYWYPIYAFIRRKGTSHHEAEDLTQAFFAHLLESRAIPEVKRERGKFRSFLLASLNNFLLNEWDKRQTIKRGGREQIVSLDETLAQKRFHEEPSLDLSPEKFFDRGWAALMVERVFSALRAECQPGRNARLHERLEPLLTQEVPAGFYGEVAGEVGMNEGSVKVALHRLRRRFGELLRREVGATLVDKASLDEELRFLLSALSD